MRSGDACSHVAHTHTSKLGPNKELANSVAGPSPTNPSSADGWPPILPLSSLWAHVPFSTPELAAGAERRHAMAASQCRSAVLVGPPRTAGGGALPLRGCFSACCAPTFLRRLRRRGSASVVLQHAVAGGPQRVHEGSCDGAGSHGRRADCRIGGWGECLELFRRRPARKQVDMSCLRILVGRPVSRDPMTCGLHAWCARVGPARSGREWSPSGASAPALPLAVGLCAPIHLPCRSAVAAGPPPSGVR